MAVARKNWKENETWVKLEKNILNSHITSTKTFINRRFPFGHTLHHHIEKITLKFFKNRRFDLKKLKFKKIQNTF